MRPLATFFAAAFLLAACSAPGGDGCAWVREIVPDQGFEWRWSVNEKRQVVALNRAVREFCGAPVVFRGVITRGGRKSEGV
jgi:hypothetical protein